MIIKNNSYIKLMPEAEFLLIFSGKGFASASELAAEFNILSPAKWVEAEQVHGVGVAIPESGQVFCSGADALVSAEEGTALIIRTADCVPLLIYDSKTGAVAAVHAGLRGTIGNIVSQTIKSMQDTFHVEPSTLTAYIGPSIRKCCYEVDLPVVEEISHFDFFSEIFQVTKPQKGQLDLPLFNRYLLQKAGVLPGNIYDLGLCTSCCSDLFYSYRARKDAARMYSMILRRRTS